MKSLSFCSALITLMCFITNQTSGNVIQAVSCSQNDVQFAIDLAQDNDTVLVPAGNCSWANSVTIHNKSISVLGPGKENITITLDGSSAFSLKAETGGSNSSRISGFSFDVTDASACIEISCEIDEGCSQSWRVDHNEFFNNSGSTKEMIFGFGNPTCYPFGLVDNNIIHNGRVVVFGETYDTGGNSRWAEPLDIGTEKSVYVEDNIFYTTAYGAGYVNWIDGNVPGQSGWLCRDQPGASTDASLWDFSTPAPTQERAPMYAWNNKGNGGVEMPFEVLDFCPENLIHIQENREFYNYTETFDGTSGVGIGTLANRPSTCTPGVGYWGTDAGS